MGFFIQQIMVKLTKRKGFNFFRSYYDVYNELETKEDKVAFIDALLDRQFLGIKPTELTGMSKFAYISQTNSIDSQVKGYEDKTKTKLNPLEIVFLPPTEGVILPPTEQVEEKVEEKEKEEVEVKLDSDSLYNIDKLQEFYLSNEKVVNAIIDNKINNIKNKEHLISRLKEFKVILTQQGRLSEKYGEYTRYFIAWNRKAPLKQITNKRPTDNITS